MSRYRISVPCKECGATQENTDRISRKQWQKLIFPHSGKFKCRGCSAERFVANVNAFVLEPAQNQLANY